MITFTNRFTNAVICEFDVPTVRQALERAAKDKAVLRGADLRGAYLRGAYLSGADLRGEKLTKTPLFISNLTWPVTITTINLTIGCQHHTHTEWEQFSDELISRMDGRALAFWKQWKTPLMAMCKEFSAEVAK